jgi:transcriptional regulator of NAD metabolism
MEVFYMPGGTEGTMLGIAAFVNSSFDSSTKLAHDRYEVYVNGDFVGQKCLLSTREDVTSVNEFLHAQGYNDFLSNIDGDHYHIQTTKKERELKQALQIYLHTR